MRRNIWTRLASMAMAVIATIAFVCPALAAETDGNKVLLTRYTDAYGTHFTRS